MITVNEARKGRMAEKVIEACGGSVRGQAIAVLGIAFKPNTDDVRESPSLTVVPALQAAGATVRAYDPQGMEEGRRQLDDVSWCQDAYDCMSDADALVILTEWNEFRALDLKRVKALLRRPLVIDLRNIYRREEMAAAGFRYVSVGRAPAGSLPG